MSDKPTEDDEERIAELYEAALAHEKGGAAEEAAAAYRALLALDPHDRGGAAVRLAALGAAPAPERASPAYVTLLFDQHADVFDQLLVEQLGYDVPLQLRDALAEALAEPTARFLDLGCGTGLLGEALGGRFSYGAGVDLSEAMIEIAGEKEVYDDLYIGDALQFLTETAPQLEPWTLIAATDVLPYIGDVRPLLAAAAARLAPGALLAISTETLPEERFGGAPFVVGPRHRFAHRLGAIEAALSEAGLALLSSELIVVRHDEGEATPGHLIIAQRKP